MQTAKNNDCGSKVIEMLESRNECAAPYETGIYDAYNFEDEVVTLGEYYACLDQLLLMNDMEDVTE